MISISNMYYIGTIKDNIVNKPIRISGTTERCVEKLLNYSDMDIFSDFNYFSDNRAWLLFYKLIKEDREIIDMPFVDDSECKTEIEYNEFPIVCDGKILKNGNSYHLGEVKLIDYSNFKCLCRLDYNLLDKILKDESCWNSNKELNYFVEEIINAYKIISKWILNNEVIYWWQYC